MTVGRALLASWLTATVAFTFCGCASAPKRGPAPHPVPPAGPPASSAPAAQAVPDAVPRVEPRSQFGNPPFYEVFGRRYYVLPSSADFVERGVASWYGPGFHKISTSTHETYDMYAMTAAHKTLPLPCYVRVTNLQNGRSVVVRVNDRGPFVGNRIIDLSYTAAAKLDMLRDGTAMVEIRTIDPRSAPMNPAVPPPAAPAPTAPTLLTASIATAAAAIVPSAQAAPAATPAPAPAPAPATAPGVESRLFVQAGAFLDPANAERLAAKLRGDGYGNAFVLDSMIAGRKMYRVRIGPVPDVPQFDRIVEALEHAGVHDAHLAMD